MKKNVLIFIIVGIVLISIVGLFFSSNQKENNSTCGFNISVESTFSGEVVEGFFWRTGGMLSKWRVEWLGIKIRDCIFYFVDYELATRWVPYPGGDLVVDRNISLNLVIGENIKLKGILQPKNFSYVFKPNSTTPSKIIGYDIVNATLL